MLVEKTMYRKYRCAKAGIYGSVFIAVVGVVVKSGLVNRAMLDNLKRIVLHQATNFSGTLGHIQAYENVPE